MYACTASTEEGARCRTLLEAPGMCGLHLKMAQAKTAPAPDSVLIKFNINPNWSQKLEKLGVPRKALLSMAKEEKHIDQAKQVGRDPFAYGRSVADSGVPVFGKEGLSGVSIFEVLKELISEYNIVDIHLRPRRDEKMDVLTITLGKEEKNTTISSAATMQLLDFLAVSSWGHCHVWANPPDNGKVIHTVNSSHRLSDTKPAIILKFAGGLWAAEPA